MKISEKLIEIIHNAPIEKFDINEETLIIHFENGSVLSESLDRFILGRVDKWISDMGYYILFKRGFCLYDKIVYEEEIPLYRYKSSDRQGYIKCAEWILENGQGKA